MDKNDFVFFWYGIYSQWHQSEFIVNGICYNNAEQYMMAMKAKTFGDNDTLIRIMSCTDPKTIKALGRQVANFDVVKWDAVKFGIVVDGNYAKFTQSSKLQSELLSTGDRIMVEASPVDKIWGIGMADDAVNADLICDPTNWRGENLLGKALIEVRQKIKNKILGVSDGVTHATIDLI